MNIGRILVHLKSTGSHLALPGPSLGPIVVSYLPYCYWALLGLVGPIRALICLVKTFEPTFQKRMAAVKFLADERGVTLSSRGRGKALRVTDLMGTDTANLSLWLSSSELVRSAWLVVAGWCEGDCSQLAVTLALPSQ